MASGNTSQGAALDSVVILFWNTYWNESPEKAQDDFHARITRLASQSGQSVAETASFFTTRLLNHHDRLNYGGSKAREAAYAMLETALRVRTADDAPALLAITRPLTGLFIGDVMGTHDGLDGAKTALNTFFDNTKITGVQRAGLIINMAHRVNALRDKIQHADSRITALAEMALASGGDTPQARTLNDIMALHHAAGLPARTLRKVQTAARDIGDNDIRLHATQQILKAEPGALNDLQVMADITGDTTEYEAALRAAVERTPEKATLRSLLGNFLVKTGKVDEGIAQLEAGLECPNAEGDKLSVLLNSLGFAHLKRVPQADPASLSDANRADLQKARGYFTENTALCLMAGIQDKSLALSFMGMGQAFEREGLTNQAIGTYENAISVFPLDAAKARLAAVVGAPADAFSFTLEDAHKVGLITERTFDIFNRHSTVAGTDERIANLGQAFILVRGDNFEDRLDYNGRKGTLRPGIIRSNIQTAMAVFERVAPQLRDPALSVDAKRELVTRTRKGLDADSV